MKNQMTAENHGKLMPDRRAGFLREATLEHPTPYVEVNYARLKRNLVAVQSIADRAGVSLRPHIKTHKSVQIALLQVSLGATGITASKPTEALLFIEAGIDNLTLAYPVVCSSTVDPLLDAARSRAARIALIVSDAIGLDAVRQAARRHDLQLKCFLKVDVGLKRVGVEWDSRRAIDLAKAINDDSSLTFAGLLSHAGHSYSTGGGQALRDIAAKEAEQLMGLRDRLSSIGLKTSEISTGSTPTTLGAPIADCVTEIRPGNYAFLDMTAVRLGIGTADDLALTVVARIIAVNDRFAIIDAGSKALSSDTGPHGTNSGYGIAVPDEPTLPIYVVERLSEEHGFLAIRGPQPKVGSLVRIFPAHSCAIAAQFSSFVLRGDNGNDDVTLFDARGCLT